MVIQSLVLDTGNPNLGYPKLKVNRETGAIVLFTAPGVGCVLVSPSRHTTFRFGKFVEDEFELFTGTILISN